jgi:hypothetical protein
MRGVITIHEVPLEIRTKGAAQARQQLHALLSNPLLTEAQRKELLKHLAWVARWEAADVEDLVPRPASKNVSAPALPPRTPQHHVVEVTEELEVHEDS